MLAVKIKSNDDCAGSNDSSCELNGDYRSNAAINFDGKAKPKKHSLKAKVKSTG